METARHLKILGKVLVLLGTWGVAFYGMQAAKN